MSTALERPHAAVEARLHAVRGHIASAARRAGRDPDSVTLVAVSKTFPASIVREAVQAGVTDLGENRVQEAEAKRPDVDVPARWHLIGHLQRNKVGKALELFDLIHGIDSLDLLRATGARASRAGGDGEPETSARVLLQVNVSGAASQHGFAPESLEREASELGAVTGVSIDGLMCIAPHVDDPEQTRPAFRKLATLHGALSHTMRAAGHPWRHLSMGMSNDYSVAIEEGATLVRIGRAIFGEREAADAHARGNGG